MNSTAAPVNDSVSAKTSKIDIAKKIVDIVDDVWSALRGGLIPKKIIEMIGPFLVGGLMFFIHTVEGYHAAQEIYEAYWNPDIGQRKTRFVTSGISFFLTGAGVGLSVALLISALSEMGVIGAVSVVGTGFFPVIIPALLLGVYSLSLWRKIYSWDVAKDDVAQAKHAFELMQLRPDCDKNKLTHAYDLYVDAYKARLSAEREVAFTVIEVFASALVVTGIALSTAALFGAATIATFGALPLAFLITGVLIGSISKVIEYKDEKNDFAYSKRLRNFFMKCIGKKSDAPVMINQSKPNKVHKNNLSTPAKLHSLFTPSDARITLVEDLCDQATEVERSTPHSHVRAIEKREEKQFVMRR